LNYTKRFQKHDININVGHESQYSFSENLSGQVTGYTSNNIPELSAGDLKLLSVEVAEMQAHKNRILLV